MAELKCKVDRLLDPDNVTLSAVVHTAEEAEVIINERAAEIFQFNDYHCSVEKVGKDQQDAFVICSGKIGDYVSKLSLGCGWDEMIRFFKTGQKLEDIFKKQNKK